jgi:hypothetical protein
MTPSIQIGIVTGIEYATNREGERTVIMLQVDLGNGDTDSPDIQSVQLYSRAGLVYVPPIDSAVTVVSIADNFKIAIASDDGLDPIEIEEGEQVLYSSDSDGILRTKIQLLIDGTIEIQSIDALEAVKSSIKLGIDGIVHIGDSPASDFVALAAKVKTEIDKITNLLTTWTVLPMDGGAALQTAAKLVWPTGISESTAATKVKAT